MVRAANVVEGKDAYAGDRVKHAGIGRPAGELKRVGVHADSVRNIQCSKGDEGAGIKGGCIARNGAQTERDGPGTNHPPHTHHLSFLEPAQFAEFVADIHEASLHMQISLPRFAKR